MCLLASTFVTHEGLVLKTPNNIGASLAATNNIHEENLNAPQDGALQNFHQAGHVGDCRFAKSSKQRLYMRIELWST